MLASMVATGLLAITALAQSDGVSADWGFHRTEDGQAIAALSYDNGLTLGVRCSDDVLSVLVSGLPPEDGFRRFLQTDFAGSSGSSAPWFIGSNQTTAFDPFPGFTARQLRKGGPLRLTVPEGAENGADLVYAVDLPTSQSAVDDVLTACDIPLVDPLDDELAALPNEGLPAGFTWARRPRPSFPSEARYARGFVNVICLAQPDGALTQCRIEAEYPSGSGFGEAVLRASRAARIQAFDGSEPGRAVRVAVPFMFRMGNDPNDDDAVDRQQRLDRRNRENDRDPRSVRSPGP